MSCAGSWSPRSRRRTCSCSAHWTGWRSTCRATPGNLYERVAREVTRADGTAVRAWVYVAAPAVAARLRAGGTLVEGGTGTSVVVEGAGAPVVLVRSGTRPRRQEERPRPGDRYTVSRVSSTDGTCRQRHPQRRPVPHHRPRRPVQYVDPHLPPRQVRHGQGDVGIIARPAPHQRIRGVEERHPHPQRHPRVPPPGQPQRPERHRPAQIRPQWPCTSPTPPERGRVGAASRGRDARRDEPAPAAPSRG